MTFVPGRFEGQIADAVGRYLAWKGDDECLAFTVVTDVHSYIGGISEPPNYRDPKMHFAPLQGYKVRRKRGQAPTAKTRFPRTDAFAEMLLAFVACSKGSLGDVAWDFRGMVGRDVRLAGRGGSV